MITMKQAQCLYLLARDTSVGCIVEVGSYRGRSTIALALGVEAGNHNTPVYAIDPHEPFVGVLGGSFGPEDRAAFYRTMLVSGVYHRVRLINLSSEVVGPGWRQPVGLLWLDGDHRYESVRRDFEIWGAHLTAGARVAFDDALDPELGPARLIRELVSGDDWRESQQVDKMRVLQRA